MSFLQRISQNNREKYSNPAIYQLERTRYAPKRNMSKSESKELVTVLGHFQKESGNLQINLTFLNESRSHSSNNSKGHQISKGTEKCQHSNEKIMRVSQILQPISSERGGSESRMNKPDSFSNYLSKYQNGYSVVCLNRKEKLQDFNIDDLSSSIVIPKKLSHKIENKESRQTRNKRNINLSHFQSYLKEVDTDKDRYHQSNKSSALSSETRVQTKSSFLDVIPENNWPTRKATSIWRKKNYTSKEDQMQGDNLLPWRQNQQEPSPFNRNNHKFKKYTYNFEDFVEP